MAVNLCCRTPRTTADLHCRNRESARCSFIFIKIRDVNVPRAQKQSFQLRKHCRNSRNVNHVCNRLAKGTNLNNRNYGHNSFNQVRTWIITWKPSDWKQLPALLPGNRKHLHLLTHHCKNLLANPKELTKHREIDKEDDKKM